MALKAKITNITSVERSIQIDFSIIDDTANNRVVGTGSVNYDATATITANQVRADIIAIATPYKTAITKAANLQGNIGTEIEI